MASNAPDEKPVLALVSPVFPPKGGVFIFFKEVALRVRPLRDILVRSWRKKEAPAASVVARARDIGDGAEAVL